MQIVARQSFAPAAAVARAAARLTRAAVWCGRRAAASWKHRNDMIVLAGLDERALADMGLTRADIRDALAQPLWRDPTAVLALRRDERQVQYYRAVFTQLVREQKSSPRGPGADQLRYPPLNRPARLIL